MRLDVLLHDVRSVRAASPRHAGSSGSPMLALVGPPQFPSRGCGPRTAHGGREVVYVHHAAPHEQGDVMRRLERLRLELWIGDYIALSHRRGALAP